MIDVVEVSYRVVQAQQQKYVCRCYGCDETAKFHDLDPAAYLHAAIVAADRDELLLARAIRGAAPRTVGA